jgi:hypothetical protein
MNKTKLLIIAVLCCAVFVTVNAQKRINLNDTSSPAKLEVKMQDIPKEHVKEAKAGRVFTINKALQSAQSVKIGNIVDYNGILFEVLLTII